MGGDGGDGGEGEGDGHVTSSSLSGVLKAFDPIGPATELTRYSRREPGNAGEGIMMASF
jgi:hypothetical protein